MSKMIENGPKIVHECVDEGVMEVTPADARPHTHGHNLGACRRTGPQVDDAS